MTPRGNPSGNPVLVHTAKAKHAVIKQRVLDYLRVVKDVPVAPVGKRQGPDRIPGASVRIARAVGASNASINACLTELAEEGLIEIGYHPHRKDRPQPRWKKIASVTLVQDVADPPAAPFSEPHWAPYADPAIEIPGTQSKPMPLDLDTSRLPLGEGKTAWADDLPAPLPDQPVVERARAREDDQAPTPSTAKPSVREWTALGKHIADQYEARIQTLTVHLDELRHALAALEGQKAFDPETCIDISDLTLNQRATAQNLVQLIREEG